MMCINNNYKYCIKMSACMQVHVQTVNNKIKKMMFLNSLYTLDTETGVAGHNFRVMYLGRIHS